MKLFMKNKVIAVVGLVLMSGLGWYGLQEDGVTREASKSVVSAQGTKGQGKSIGLVQPGHDRVENKKIRDAVSLLKSGKTIDESPKDRLDALLANMKTEDIPSLEDDELERRMASIRGHFKDADVVSRLNEGDVDMGERESINAAMIAMSKLHHQAMARKLARIEAEVEALEDVSRGARG